jgi:midasin (ATPase involved in ribosome maturation)
LYQNAVIPVAHINQASTLLNGLVKSDSRSFINFLFDIHSVSLSNFMSNFVDKTNAAYAETDNGHNPYAALLKDSVSIDWLKGLQHIQTVEAHPILQTFSSVWNEFVQSNGLSPVHLAVVGPPKSGKTNLAKTISSM